MSEGGENDSFAKPLLMGGIAGKKEVEVHGKNIHPGDWGSGRVALNKQGRVNEGPCGNANKRSEFFLHGGLLAGSSGCIDVGGDFATLADYIEGYGRSIVLTVGYEHGLRPPGAETRLRTTMLSRELRTFRGSNA